MWREPIFIFFLEINTPREALLNSRQTHVWSELYWKIKRSDVEETHLGAAVQAKKLTLQKPGRWKLMAYSSSIYSPPDFCGPPWLGFPAWWFHHSCLCCRHWLLLLLFIGNKRPVAGEDLLPLTQPGRHISFVMTSLSDISITCITNACGAFL